MLTNKKLLGINFNFPNYSNSVCFKINFKPSFGILTS